MARDYSSVPEKDLAAGINQQAAEDSIPPGYVEHALNVDFNSEGLVEKRVGFRKYLGDLPIRVAKVSQKSTPPGEPDLLTFHLTTNTHPNIDVDLGEIPPGPLLVVGKTHSYISDFGTKYPAIPGTLPVEYTGIPIPTSRYYAKFNANPRKKIIGSYLNLLYPQQVTLTAAEHNVSSFDLLVGTTQSNSQTNKDNTHFFANAVEINKSTYDVTIIHQNTQETFDAFIYVLNASESGTGYAQTYAATNSITILDTEHNLNTLNILGRAYEDSAGILKEVIPETFVINENTGTITFTFSEIGTYRIVLYAATAAQQFIDSVIPGADASLSQGQFVIPDLTEDFIFLDCFTGDGLGNWTKVMPQEVVVDTKEAKATVFFSNTSLLSENILFTWEYAKVKSTTITVESYTKSTGDTEDLEPELVIYGLVAESIFPTKESPRSGWLQHIDTYKSEGFSTVVAGLGWNLFQAVEHIDAPDYLQTDTFYPALRARVKDQIYLAPLFQEITAPENIKRTRGAIVFTGGGSGWASINSIQWDETEAAYWITLDTPAKQAITKPGFSYLKSFTTTERYGDLLLIRGAELRAFDGEWPIWQIDESIPNKTKFLIKTTFSSSDYNCLSSGEAGVFTDTFPIDHRPLLTRGDTLTAQSFPQGVLLSYIGTDRATNPNLFVSNVSEEILVAAGQLVTFTRNSKFCFGPRTADGTERSFVLTNGASFSVVRGDNILVSGRVDPIEVIHIISQELTDITAFIEDEILTLTNVTEARQFSVGQKILLQDLGYDAQEFEVLDIGADNTTLTLAAPGILDIPASSPLSSCKIFAQMEFREFISIGDDTFNRSTFIIEGRWEPIEKPQIDYENLGVYNNVPVRTTEHFKADEYGTQSVLRSAMSQNTLYLTNGKDPVMKFDGAHLYRAGIPRWNPQLFIRLEEDGAIPNPGRAFYYFRLGGITANGQTIISAVTGSEDYYVTLPNSNTHNIHLRLCGFPVWDNYDFEKVVLQIYRTAIFSSGTPVGPHYLVAELEIPQIKAGSYIDFIDTEANNTWDSLPDDTGIFSTAENYGKATTLSEPLRAKYVTTVNNRLILGNLRGYQEMELRMFAVNKTLIFADFVGKTFNIYRDSQNLTAVSPADKATFGYVNTHIHISTKTFTDPINALLSIVCTSSIPNGVSVGDWVYLSASYNTDDKSGKLKGVGWYQIRGISNTTTFTINAPNDGPFSGTEHLGCKSVVFRTTNMPFGTVPIYLGTDDYNFGFDDGNFDAVMNVTFRTAAAINCFSCMVNPNIIGQSNYTPWIMADSGGEFDRGTLVLRKPLNDTSFAFVAEDFEEVKVLWNGIQYTDKISIVSQAPVFPSRIIYSYPNFPELFNKTTQRNISAADDDSNLPIDVNPADGQEITGIIPFFGESAFGQATRESLLVVFKTNSIYLVNIQVDKNTGIADNQIQKIESQGLGCTAPYSIASTKDGIMFANESGIYKLTRQLTVEPIGQFVDRIWREEVDLDQLSLAQGHHFGVGRQYKLSVPLQDATNNTDVLVYEHTRESRGQAGAWGRYDNHEVTGWANLFTKEFFGTTHARVCVRRSSASKWDYSDRGTAIVATVDLRPNDLGIPNTRKRLLHVSVHFRNPQENTLNISQQSTTVGLATDLKEDFLPCDKYESGGLFSKTGISDLGLLKGETIRFSAPTSKAIQYQVKIENAGLYETLQFSGVTYRVSAMSTKGTKEADDTTKK